VRRRSQRRAIGLAALFFVSMTGGAVPASEVAAALDQDSATAQIEQAIDRYSRAMETADRDERIALFGEAERLFAAAADAGVESADLETNRGNAALQAERLGAAILAYRRALRLDPGHSRARRNLAHARELLPDAIPRPVEGGLADTFFFWRDRLSTERIQIAAAACFALAAALLALTIVRPVPGLRVVAGFVLATWAALLVSILLDPRGDGTDAGVVLVPDAIARAADSINAPQRFSEPLPAGTEVRVLEDRGDWLQIELGNGRSAWLPASTLVRVVEPQTAHGER
jgi:tetratricopeptide (TPR) repeat protein